MLKVLSCEPEGQILRAHCQLKACHIPEVDIQGDVLLLLKTDPKIEAKSGDLISIRRPWQSLLVDGVKVLLVQHADVNP